MTTAYISVGTYFPQFEEYIVATPKDQLEEMIKICKEDMESDKIKSFRDKETNKYFVGVVDGEKELKLSMESMKKAITKYTPFMINHLREKNDKRYTDWNTDIALYVAYNFVLNGQPITLVGNIDECPYDLFTSSS